jgi:hypothetical protein
MPRDGADAHKGDGDGSVLLHVLVVVMVFTRKHRTTC